MSIGYERPATPRVMDGLIDDVCIFNKALSQSDIKRVILGLHPIGG